MLNDSSLYLSIVLYVGGLGVAHTLHLPNLRRMNALMTELAAMGLPPAGGTGGGPPPQVLELEERGGQAGLYGGTLNILVVIIVILMVWKPGL